MKPDMELDITQKTSRTDSTSKPSRLIYYTQVCAPCEDNVYHYWQTLGMARDAGFDVHERYIAALPAWKKEAEAFNAPLPLLYCPAKQSYLSIGENFNEDILKAFLESLK